MLDRVAASGRPFAVFTNGSHMAPDAFARELRAAGLPVEDGQVITPLCSVQAYLERFSGEARVLPFATEPARAYLDELPACSSSTGSGARVDAVFVAHTDGADFDELERAARAVIAGARLLTGSYVPAYAGADGPILSRGAMVTAAIAKASGARPIVVGKPSRAAVREMRAPARSAVGGGRGRRRRLRPRRRARPARRLDDGARPQRGSARRSTSRASPRRAVPT